MLFLSCDLKKKCIIHDIGNYLDWLIMGILSVFSTDPPGLSRLTIKRMDCYRLKNMSLIHAHNC